MARNIGTLIVQVLSARGALPVPQARVRISVGRRLISDLLSDISGNTERIDFSTPPLENSQYPSGREVFSNCDAQITCDGYGEVLVRNIQIFPGVTTVLPVMMVPRSEFGEAPEIQIVEIGTQQL